MSQIARRTLFAQAGAFAAAGRVMAAETDLGLPGGPATRPIATSFPGKGPMVLQRSRPPLLETPFEVFDRGVFTPNDQFFVRWHWASLPARIDPAAFRLAVDGHVNQPVTLTLDDILALPRVELAAVNQCSGNSRGFFAPRVAGGEWANGAMGNALWTGVALRDVLDRAGVKSGAQRVRFGGLDDALLPDAPKFLKSIPVDHARDGEVMIAYAMNGAPLPFLNGFPLRLVVPGWYSTYWIKMLSRIEVLDGPDENFWVKTAYTIPDTPGADMKPGQTGIRMVPINAMVPRSFLTNLRDGQTVPATAPLAVRGIAFGGDCGVAAVDLSTDGGVTWQSTALGPDQGRYGFRGWSATIAPARGACAVLVRCTNTAGLAQPATPNWNPSGFMRNVIETTTLQAT